MNKIGNTLILILVILSIFFVMPYIVTGTEDTLVENTINEEPVYQLVGICRILSSGRTWCYFGRVLVTPGDIINIG